MKRAAGRPGAPGPVARQISNAESLAIHRSTGVPPTVERSCTVWPAAIVIGVLSATTDAVPPSLIAVLLHLAFGGLLYMAIFTLCGLDKDERQWLLSTFTGMRSRYNPPLAAESALR